MLKQLVSALTAVCCLASSAAMTQAAQNDAETAKFYYTQNGETLNISLNGSINKESRAADAVLAVYDGDVLISTTIVHMDEDIESLSMGDFTITLPYAPEAPSVKSFLWASDGSCEPLGNVSQLSGIPGNAVEWYGWVTATSRTNLGLDNDEVSFIVLNSPDMDISSSIQFTAKAGNTDIDDRLFEYVKASVIIDDDTDEYTILDYETLSNEQTVSFPASALISYELAGEAGQEPSKSLTVGIDDGTAHYSLADDTEIYVNGVSLWLATEELTKSYILDNPTGTVKLVDTADTDGKTDGIFDFIMVSYYVDGIVDDVSLSDTQSRIYFKSCDAFISRARLEWDPSDDDIHVSFTDTNGETVDPSTITEYDVLSIAYDVSSDFANSFFYDVIVSRNVVHGAVSVVDLRANTVTVNGTAYPVTSMILAGEIPIGEEYTFFINAFGYIAHYADGSVTPPTPPEPEIPSNEFSFNSAGSTTYISSANEVYTIEGTLRLDTSGEPKPLTAEIELSQGGSALGSKSIAIPAGSDRLDLGGSALECSGTPDSAVLYIKDGDNILYTKKLALTSSSDIYTVRGRITGTFKNDAALGYDEVAFLIENADDFDGSGPIKYDTKPITANSVISGSDDMLFIYSEAEIAKNEDGSYTLISLMPLSSNGTTSFPADLFESFSGGYQCVLYVYESEYSSSVTSYRLSPDAELYVNGVCAGSVEENQDLLYYAMDDIKLVDMSQTASTASDGYYDYVFIERYSECVAEETAVNGGTVSISRMLFSNDEPETLDINTDDAKLSITLDGTEISPDELQPYDVLSIVYDATEGLLNSRFYEIQVCRDTVKGMIAEKNVADNSIKVNGEKMYLSDLLSIDNCEFNTEYILYLTPSGKVIMLEENGLSELYGIVTHMYRSAGSTSPTVRLLTSNGEVMNYECRSQEDADNFYRLAVGGDEYTSYYNDLTLSETYNRILAGENICRYRLSNGRAVFVDTVEPEGGENLVYDADAGTLGSYQLNDSAALISIDSYLDGSSDKIYTLTPEDLTDGSEYTAYICAPTSSGKYNLVFILSGETNLPEYDPENDPTYAEDKLGVITGMYMSAGSSYATVRLADSDGNVTAYECRSQEDEKSFFEAASGETAPEDIYELTIHSILDRITDGKTIVSYSVRNGKISFNATAEPKGGEGTAFNGSMLGDDDISSVPVLYLGEYIYNDGKPYLLTAEALTGSEYTAYTVIDGDGNVKLAVVMDGNAELPEYDPESDQSYIAEGFGIMTGMYMSAGSTYPKIRLINEDGQEMTYECRSQEDADNFYDHVTGSGSGYRSELTFNDIVFSYGIENAAVKYSVSDSRARMLEGCEPAGGSLEYYEETMSLGDYTLSDSAVLLDIGGKIEGGSSAAAVTPEMLVGGACYTAYMYDKDPDTGTYGYAMFLSGIGSLSPVTKIAVVTDSPSYVSIDGYDYISVPVLRNGTEETLLYEGYDSFSQGDILIYEPNNNGIVSDWSLFKLTDMSDLNNYSKFRHEILSRDDFSDIIAYDAFGEGNELIWSTPNKKTEVYFGPIYNINMNNLKLLTSSSTVEIDGFEYSATNIDSYEQTMSFFLTGDEISYIYDFSQRSGSPMRVYAGRLNSLSDAVLKPAMTQTFGGNYVLWDSPDTYAGTVLAEDLRPNFAFVKTIDDVVSEVVYFITD